jgi:hypothetical protein
MTQDGRLLRGMRSRETILQQAVGLASVEGLAGLSLGRLATTTGHPPMDRAGGRARRAVLQRLRTLSPHPELLPED